MTILLNPIHHRNYYPSNSQVSPGRSGHYLGRPLPEVPNAALSLTAPSLYNHNTRTQYPHKDELNLTGRVSLQELGKLLADKENNTSVNRPLPMDREKKRTRQLAFSLEEARRAGNAEQVKPEDQARRVARRIEAEELDRQLALLDRQLALRREEAQARQQDRVQARRIEAEEQAQARRQEELDRQLALRLQAEAQDGLIRRVARRVEQALVNIWKQDFYKIQNVHSTEQYKYIRRQFKALRKNYAQGENLTRIDFTALQYNIQQAMRDFQRNPHDLLLQRALSRVKSICQDPNRVLDHNFTARELLYLAWKMIQAQQTQAQKHTGIENLMIGLKDAAGYCSTRHAGEILNSLSISYPDGPVVPNSKLEFDDARDIMLELSTPILRGVKNALPEQQQQKFQKRLQVALASHPNISADHVTRFLRDFAFRDWDEFKDLASNTANDNIVPVQNGLQPQEQARGALKLMNLRRFLRV
jgi:hypothetical protein